MTAFLSQKGPSYTENNQIERQSLFGVPSTVTVTDRACIYIYLGFNINTMFHLSNSFLLSIVKWLSKKSAFPKFPVVAAAAVVVDDELGGVAWCVEEGAVGRPQVDGRRHRGRGRVRCGRIRGRGADSENKG